MDIQFWIWLIIIVITLIARASRQKRPQPPSRQDYREEDKPNTPPLTFEELLREIQAAKEQRQQPSQQETTRPFRQSEPIRPYAEAEPEPTVYKEVDYDDNVGEEAQDLETITEERDDRQSMDVYERAKRDAFSRPSLEETLKLEDTIVRFGQFKGYETPAEKAPMADFLAEINNPEGFRKAFIMSEILTRKF